MKSCLRLACFNHRIQSLICALRSRIVPVNEVHHAVTKLQVDKGLRVQVHPREELPTDVAKAVLRTLCLEIFKPPHASSTVL